MSLLMVCSATRLSENTIRHDSGIYVPIICSIRQKTGISKKNWKANILKLQLHVNKVPVDAVARVVHYSEAERIGKAWVTKFKEHVDRQMFEVVIQAVAGKKVVARETLKPFRKDVLQKLHAADVSRRRKLLEKQKEGRRKLRAVGNVAIDNKAFQAFLAK